jgi:formylglycine-generating enzyme required for sulfatase activity
LAHTLENAKPGEAVTLHLPGAAEIELSWCPPGWFMMGSPATELHRKPYENPVPVFLSQGFWLARTECTQQQWLAVEGHNPSVFPGSARPVDSVSWDDTLAFIAGLNQTVPLPDGWQWSLPTEAEWEYACRARSEPAFAFGNTLTSDLANFNGNFPYPAHFGDGLNRGLTTAVARFPANKWGLFDMHGNLHEWCLDHWGGFQRLPGGNDPLETLGSDRIVRGGSWAHDGQDCRSAARSGWDPHVRRSHIGFRLAVKRARA